MLAAADRTLRGHERLSTAYEYGKRHADHPFNAALMDEADRLAPRVEPRQVLPLRLPRRLWAIPVLLLATLALNWIETPTWSFATLGDADFSRQVVREGQRLEQWGDELERLAKQEHLDRSLVLARQLQNLGKHLQDERAPQDAFGDRIASLSDYLQRLREELRERALMSGMGRLAVRDTLPSGKSLKQELRDVLKTLGRRNTVARPGGGSRAKPAAPAPAGRRHAGSRTGIAVAKPARRRRAGGAAIAA